MTISFSLDLLAQQDQAHDEDIEELAKVVKK